MGPTKSLQNAEMPERCDRSRGILQPSPFCVSVGDLATADDAADPGPGSGSGSADAGEDAGLDTGPCWADGEGPVHAPRARARTRRSRQLLELVDGSILCHLPLEVVTYT